MRYYHQPRRDADQGWERGVQVDLDVQLTKSGLRLRLDELLGRADGPMGIGGQVPPNALQPDRDAGGVREQARSGGGLVS
ncbi:hypothetical protein [Streptomyces sp. NBC_00576]|uniref:hypothetical protein n=1 Tax=Streptomyces sp. NBC_00576 TaxID=2903665 RepID=UPI002E80536D|nr:hypothetical protein [Streptomyces sp. NBC_00576]WUB77647.1 hypothetical protein OG734_02985 [Streptomyces sp. NBC_00576]